MEGEGAEFKTTINLSSNAASASASASLLLPN
jgi:hypothetical protein